MVFALAFLFFKSLIFLLKRLNSSPTNKSCMLYEWIIQIWTVKSEKAIENQSVQTWDNQNIFALQSSLDDIQPVQSISSCMSKWNLIRSYLECVIALMKAVSKGSLFCAQEIPKQTFQTAISGSPAPPPQSYPQLHKAFKTPVHS